MSAAIRLALALASTITPTVAQAHPAVTGAGGFPGGFLHPIVIPSHLLAIAGAALLIAQYVRPASASIRWTAMAVFAVGLAAGFFAIANAYAPTMTGDTLLVLAVVSGLGVAAARTAFQLTPLLLVGLTGFVVALDSPPDAVSLREAILMQLGTFCGAALLFVALIEIASRLQRDWQRLGVRILGSWIAASAILVLALRLAQ